MNATTMQRVGKTCIDEPKRLGMVFPSIPAKPLAQAKLKCGGFFIARMRRGGRA